MRASWVAAGAIFSCATGCGGGGGSGPAVPPPPAATPSPTPGPSGAVRLVHTVTISLAQPYPALGTPTTIPVTVTARDVAGIVIAPPDRYGNPITLTDEDASGHTSLTRTVLNAPSDPVALRYDGAYFPSRGLHADWLDPTGLTIEPFRQIATGIVSSESSLGAGHIVTSIARGADGALWFADWGTGAVGRAPAPGGAATFYPVAFGWSPMTVAASPDRTIWFVAGGPFSVVQPYPGVGRVALDGTMGPIWPTSYAYGRDLVVASDATAYFNQLNRVTRITPSGQMSNIPFTVGGSTAHTDTLAVGPDGALYATSVGTLLRYDLASQTQTSSAFPFPPGAIRPIEPGLLYAFDDGRLYFDDKGSAIYAQSIPSGTPILLGRGSATPGQGDALSPNAMVLARDGSVWFSSSMTTQDGHPMFGHVVGGAVQILAGQSAVARQNSNGQDVPALSIVLGSDGRLWYGRSDALGSFAP